MAAIYLLKSWKKTSPPHMMPEDFICTGKIAALKACGTVRSLNRKRSLSNRSRQTTFPLESPAMPGTHAYGHNVSSSGWQRDHCFGCGAANPGGLQMKFIISPSGDSYVCEFELGPAFGGPPGHAHGGIIATVLDEAMSKANKLRGMIALTRRIEVEYLRPVPLSQPLWAEGRVSRIRGRALYNQAELRNAEGVVLARGRGKFLAIDAETMFARELEEERKSTR
jgi:uncharacterized protein (TIGR00369 family)